MPTFEYDRRYVERGIELLESYLITEVAYWPLDIKPPSGEPPYPMLTLESVLLARQRLLAYRGSLSDESQVAKLLLALETIQSHWRVAWEKKTEQAYHTRLTMWRNFLEEYWSAPESHADRYVYEVRIRTFLTLLSNSNSRINPGKDGLLARLDGYLKIALNPGKFIWDDGYQACFPLDEYWYLYGSLPALLPERLFGLEKS